jgi:ATP-dependent DNA helicase
MHSGISSGQSAELITTLHNILKPFLLRRVKADVEFGLPPKKEYLLYAPLTEQQREVYEVVLRGGIRKYLIEGVKDKEESAKKGKDERKEDEGRKLRVRGRNKPSYDVDNVDDSAYFRTLESGEFYEEKRRREEERTMELGEAYKKKKASSSYFYSVIIIYPF